MTSSPLWSYALAGLAASALLSTGCELKNPVVPRPGAQVVAPVVALTPASPQDVSFAAKAPTAADLKAFTQDIVGSGALMASIRTDKGNFNCELFEQDAPMTVANFVGLARGLKAWTDPKTKQPQVNKPYYDGILFHRVIPGFMVQTGDPLAIGSGGPGYKFADETTPKRPHKPGTLSMANAGPRTNGSQFFINEVATPQLNGKHTVFGQCDNVDLVKKIAAAGNRKSSIQSVVFTRKS